MSDKQTKQDVESIKKAWNFDPVCDIWGFVPENDEERFLPFKDELESYQREVESHAKNSLRATEYEAEKSYRFRRLTYLAEVIFIRNSGDIGKEMGAGELAGWSFEVAERFLEIQEEQSEIHKLKVEKAVEAIKRGGN